MAFRQSLGSRRYRLEAGTPHSPWAFRHPVWLLCLLLIVAAGISYCVYGLQAWNIQQLTVQGSYTLNLDELKRLTQEQERGRWMLFFRQRSLWAFDTNAYEQRLRERWIFTDLRVKRKMPHTLALTVVQAQPAFTYAWNGQHFGIDQHGIASNLIPEDQATKFPGVTLAAVPQNVQLGDRILEQRVVDFVHTFTQTLAVSAPNVHLGSIDIAAAPDATVKLYMAGEWYILVDTLGDVNAQVHAFTLAYEQKLTGRPVQYVDVRVPDRVYYK